MLNSAPTVDEAAIGRLRLAIALEDGDEEELQLHGVLRMLGADHREADALVREGSGPAKA